MFEATPNLLSTELSITDNTGTVVGETAQKVLSLVPTFHLYEGDAKAGKLIGTIKKPIIKNMLSMGQKLDVESPEGKVVAKASGGMFGLGGASASYSITDGEGVLVAKVSTELTDSIMGTLGNLAKAAYSLQIIKQDAVPTLMLIELLLSIELLKVK